MLEVSDDGRGISPEFLPHVFEHVPQAGPVTKRGEGGLGIGLAMVKSLSELHGGRVEVESAGEGKGATFRVFLPLHESSDFVPLDPASRAAARRATSPACACCSSTTPKTRSRPSATCSSTPATGSAAPRSAREAIAPDRAAGLRPADLRRRHAEDGRLRADGGAAQPAERTVSLPAIALTGHGRPADVQHAFAAGFQAHVDKPVDFEHMKTVIATVIGAARAASRAARASREETSR